MGNVIVVGGIILWLGWGLLWVLPLKRTLLKRHGMEKTNADLMDLAKDGDPTAKTLLLRTKIFVAFGLLGGFLMTLNKYF